MSEEQSIDFNVNFGDGDSVQISITGSDDPQRIIAALRKIGQTDYLLGLYDALRGIDPEDYDDDDWDE